MLTTANGYHNNFKLWCVGYWNASHAQSDVFLLHETLYIANITSFFAVLGIFKTTAELILQKIFYLNEEFELRFLLILSFPRN